MNKRQGIALGMGLAAIAACAVFLMQLGPGQLGAPGLKLSAEPTYDTNGVLVRTQSISLPAEVAGFTSQVVNVTPLEVNWLPKDTLFGRRQYFTKDGFTALAMVVLMGTDRTSIHKPQYCLTSQGLVIEKTETAVIPMGRPHPYDLRVMKLTTSRQVRGADGRPTLLRGLYVYWFVADNLLTPHHGERMWWMAKDMVWTGVLQRWAYVTYFTECRPEQEQAVFARLKELIAASVPEYQLAAGPGPGTVSTSTARLGPVGDTEKRN